MRVARWTFGLVTLGASGFVYYACSWRPHSMDAVERVPNVLVTEPETAYRARATILDVTDVAAIDDVVVRLNAERADWHPFARKVPLHPVFSLELTSGTWAARRFDVGGYWIAEGKLIKGMPNRVADLIRAVESAPEGAPCLTPPHELGPPDDAPRTWVEAQIAERWCSSLRGAPPLVFVTECGSLATVIVAHEEAEGYDAFYYHREPPGSLIGEKRGASTARMICTGELPAAHGPCKRLARADCGLAIPDGGKVDVR